MKTFRKLIQIKPVTKIDQVYVYVEGQRFRKCDVVWLVYGYVDEQHIHARITLFLRFAIDIHMLSLIRDNKYYWFRHLLTTINDDEVSLQHNKFCQLIQPYVHVVCWDGLIF